jgi:uncharacterized delta-60 repeat protein
MSTRFVFRVATSALIAAVLAACGGADSPTAAPRQDATTAAAAMAAPSSQAPQLQRPDARALALSTGAVVDAHDAARQLFEFAEQRFPNYFSAPTPVATASLSPFDFRYYAGSGSYLGVVIGAGTPYADGGVYVMGGAFGNAPAYVGQLLDFITPLAPGFELSVHNPKVVVAQGGSTAVRVNLARLRGFEGNVQLTVQGLPAGVTAAATTIVANTSSVDITFSAQRDAPHSLPTAVTLRAESLGPKSAGVALEPITLTVRGAAGDVDTSFAGGIVRTSLGVSEDYAHAVAVQADGKVLVAGTTATNADTVIGVVRYLRDGALDTRFGNAGKVVVQVGARGDSARAIAVQADGKIVIAGWTDDTGIDANFLVLRLRADGSLDSDFAQSGKLVVPFGTGTDRAHALAIQDDGKIVVAGASEGANATGQDFALIRVLPQGQLDSSFGQGGKVVTALRSGSAGEVAYALALPKVNGEQRILAVGGEGDFMAVRYTASGALDTSFGVGGKALGLFNRNIGAARSVALLPDGRMLLAGGIYNDFAAAQLTVAGALDTSFGDNGTVVHAVTATNWDSATAVARQADGKFVLGGWAYSGNSSSADFVAMRLLPSGALDSGFGNSGIVVLPVAANGRNDAARGLVLQANDEVPTVRALLAGEASAGANDFAVLRLWL